MITDEIADQLWSAVSTQDLGAVESLLKRGADPNHECYWSKDWTTHKVDVSTEEGRNPPLHTACRDGNIEIVRALVKGRANTKRIGVYFTPFQYAIIEGHYEIVQYLAGSHYTVDAKDVEMAANFVRVGDGNLNIALFLLTDTGSQIDEATKVKVLYGGCAWGRLDVVKTIVEEHNLDPNRVYSMEGRSPLKAVLDSLNIFSYRGCVDVALYLISVVAVVRRTKSSYCTRHAQLASWMS
ncbi:protein fem-1 homolog A-like isoform X2 [Halichondria panicea]|uniref:protein fem-1 homolog A-like isoform X2 n=1 Tax=Halichondria panicea TaxID=6063 RepID=UPI00312B716C